MVRINHQKIQNISLKCSTQDPKAEDATKKLISKTKDRAEFEMTDVGFFQDIKESVANTNPHQEAANYGFLISVSDCKKKNSPRVLEFFASTKSGNYEVSRVDTIGTRKEILERLKDEKLKEDLQDFVTSASNNFMMKDLG